MFNYVQKVYIIEPHYQYYYVKLNLGPPKLIDQTLL